MTDSARAPRRRGLVVVLGAALTAFTIAEVNYPRLGPQSQLAVFTGLGLAICFLTVPFARRPELAHASWSKALDWLLALAAVLCCGYIVWQTEQVFAGSWFSGRSLGNRAGYETTLDLAVGVAGLIVVMEAARRTLGWALPLLGGLFLLYAWAGAAVPDWLFPHRGFPVERIVATAFLHTQGVFGVALSVMFTYVFLFVLFGAVLGATGATQFIIDFSLRAFGRSTGGPAKVAVISSGLMGSLSGSAVANTVATGTFTIPMMRSAGFAPHTAAGIEAAASSGGALMPPVMGAGAYMMLEIIQPPVTYLEIVRAALLPALLYYLSLYLIVHFSSRRLGVASVPMPPAPVPAVPAAPMAGGPPVPMAAGPPVPIPPVAPRGSAGAAPPTAEATSPPRAASAFAGVVFVAAFAALMGLLVAGYTPFRAVSLSLAATVLVAAFSRRTRLTLPVMVRALESSARDAVPLIAAAACVGIIIGVVMLTGVGTRLPAAIVPLAEQNLLLALIMIMVSSLVLGMGLPSAVTYLLLATLIGPALGQLGVVPLSAHLFIFYFGMMAMVTPPVALAAYAAGSIAGADIMRASMAAFRFALVGFTLPFMFVFRPELLLLSSDGAAHAGEVAQALVATVAGIAMFAAGIAGFLLRPAPIWQRAIFFLAAALLLAPGPTVLVAGWPVHVLDATGLAMAAAAAWLNRTGTARVIPPSN